MVAPAWACAHRRLVPRAGFGAVEFASLESDHEARGAGMWAITGGRGFIGRSLVRALEVRGIARRVLVGDVLDPAGVQDLVDGARVVVHLAGYVHRATRTKEQRRECWRVNVDGTANIVAACERDPARPFVIFVSSTSVYAASELPLEEVSACSPETPYGESKLEAERVVLAAVARGAIQATVLRPAMVFGPGAPGNLATLIKMVRHRVVLEVDGGVQRKSLVPVEKLVDAILAVEREREKAAGEVFNVGGGAVTMREITDVIARALGVRPVRLPVPGSLVQGIARLTDRILGPMLPATLTLSRLVRAYVTHSVVSQEKLGALGCHTTPEEVCSSLAVTAAAVLSQEASDGAGV